MSDLVNEALESIFLEDLEDIGTWRECRDEPKVGYEEVVQQLKTDGILQY